MTAVPGAAQVHIAPDNIRELGFGAGMGLPNMKRSADEFEIKSAPGAGTWIRMLVRY